MFIWFSISLFSLHGIYLLHLVGCLAHFLCHATLKHTSPKGISLQLHQQKYPPSKPIQYCNGNKYAQPKCIPGLLLWLRFISFHPLGVDGAESGLGGVSARSPSPASLSPWFTFSLGMHTPPKLSYMHSEFPLHCLLDLPKQSSSPSSSSSPWDSILNMARVLARIHPYILLGPLKHRSRNLHRTSTL